jgi:hypothetical protein
MGRYIKFLHALELPEEQIESIAWGTAARLFKIDLAPLG